MASNRKRKRVKSRANGRPEGDPLALHHPVLSLYFSHLLLLHSFLHQALSFRSKSTTSLRKLGEVVAGNGFDKDLELLLKTSVVGLKDLRAPNAALDIEDATQSTGGSHHSSASATQSEIVDLTLHTLFYRSLSTKRSNSAVYPGKPNNILAQGYTLNSHHIAAPQGLNPGPFGVEIVNLYPNTHIGTLKSPVWGRLLGIIGDEVMLDLLLNTSIFLQLDGRGDQCDVAKANYYQLAGPSLSDFLNNPVAQPVAAPSPHTSSTRPAGAPLKRCLSEIEGLDAKNIDKKIRPNRLRPAAAASLKLTNTNRSDIITPAITNDGRSDAKRSRSGKQKEIHVTKTFNNTCNNNGHASKNAAVVQRDLKTPGEIVFVRSRMFYCKPSYNGRGEVKFGLRHIHVLNRFSDPSVKSHTVQILKYIFPRQFNLHNAFTSVVDRRETVQPLKDYTVRENEISTVASLSGKPGALDVPKRLRGTVFELVIRMQKLHKRCSYHALVKHYCPVKLCDGAVQQPVTAAVLANGLATIVSDDKPATQAEIFTETPAAFGPSLPPKEIIKGGEAFMDFASDTSEVSAFARAVILKVIPRAFWGKGDGNRKLIMTNVDRFIKLRRYESYSLHEIMQGLKLTEFLWLCPDGISSSARICLSDALKRRELLAEFLFWLFDSFLIPLLGLHFYITESSAQRNRLFYFRHDVWKKISEPTLNRLKNDTFQELKLARAKRLLDRRALGYAQVRLLPKVNGVRPVMNLKRRVLKQDKYKGRATLAPSINSILKPVHNVLVFEKSRKPEKLGAAVFSVGDIYTRLKTFQAHLRKADSTLPKLFFVKVDIAACFDTIPQGALIKLIESIITEPKYRFEKHVEIRPPGPAGGGKPIRRFLAKAQLPGEKGRFADFAQAEVKRQGVSKTVFVDDVVHQLHESNSLLDLLEEHIRKNIIKIGKKFYRQKNGIPQGSILSTVLCNFFYGDLENKKLPFAFGNDCLLMRLVDDFLYITPNREKAQKFLEVMHGGLPEYGAFVGVQKTLVNFSTTVGGKEVARLADTEEFPYCGNLLNTRTLEIRKDRGGKSLTNVHDLLTIEYSKAPGKSLHRKAIGGFKMQSHPMYFDTTINSTHTVLCNIYHNFIEAAMKLHRSVASLRAIKSPSQPLLIKITSDMLELAYSMLQKGDYKCTVRKNQVRWLGAHALKKVLSRKQTNYKPLLQYLDGVAKKERGDNETWAVVKQGDGTFAGYRY